MNPDEIREACADECLAPLAGPDWTPRDRYRQFRTARREAQAVTVLITVCLIGAVIAATFIRW